VTFIQGPTHGFGADVVGVGRAEVMRLSVSCRRSVSLSANFRLLDVVEVVVALFPTRGDDMKPLSMRIRFGMAALGLAVAAIGSIWAATPALAADSGVAIHTDSTYGVSAYDTPTPRQGGR
jgi:hypothetical protein